MADTNCISSRDKERLGVLFNEIATDVMFALDILCDMSNDIDSGNNKLHAKGWAIETLLKKIGWMADNETTLIGESQAVGNASNWFMSPAYLGFNQGETKNEQ